jgi:hypothetical protein
MTANKVSKTAAWDGLALPPASDHSYLPFERNAFVGIADALASRGAGARGGDDTPPDPKKHPNIDGRCMAHHLEIRVRIDAHGRLLRQHLAEIA